MMTSRLEKFLAKLSKKERKRLDIILEKLSKDWKNAGDIKALKGLKDFFRLRAGRFRIIFQVIDEEPFVIKIGLRDDHFYDEI